MLVYLSKYTLNACKWMFVCICAMLNVPALVCFKPLRTSKDTQKITSLMRPVTSFGEALASRDLIKTSVMRSRYVAAPRNLRGPRSTHKGDNPETDYISFALLGDVLCRRGKQ